MIDILKEDLHVRLCRPDEYYRGTRFDHAGVFRGIEKGGFSFADRWFDTDDPLRHDCVCGPSEEFVTVDFDGVEAGGLFCKVGVGLLRRPDEKAYDWFRLYEIANPGEWRVVSGEDFVTFRHHLEGWYDYEKTVRLVSGNQMTIGHELCWMASKPLSGYHYNHNFFTFGGAVVGPGRQIDFPFRPGGDWRSPYRCVALTDSGIRFCEGVELPSVYMGNVHSQDGPTPYAFRISEGVHRVTVQCAESAGHFVFWSNPRVACIEPYLPIKLLSGQSSGWKICYRFE